MITCWLLGLRVEDHQRLFHKISKASSRRRRDEIHISEEGELSNLIKLLPQASRPIDRGLGGKWSEFIGYPKSPPSSLLQL